MRPKQPQRIHTILLYDVQCTKYIYIHNLYMQKLKGDAAHC